MKHFVILAIVTLCILRGDASAEEPSQLLVVAANSKVASAILPLPKQFKLVVLIENEEESYEAVSQRAQNLLGAAYFVHSGSDAHALLPIFSERFQNHGVNIVDLRKKHRQNRSHGWVRPRPAQFLLAIHSQLP